MNCPQGEHRTLISELIANTRSRTGAVATLACALHDETLLNRAVAADVLCSAFRSPWGPTCTAARSPTRTSRRAQPNGPSEAQCQRSRKLLEKVVDSKALSEQVRGSALISLAYQWADEETLKFAQSETKSSNKSLAEHAQRTVERLTQRLHPPKAATNSPKAPIAPVRAAGAAVAPRAVPAPVAPAAAPAPAPAQE